MNSVKHSNSEIALNSEDTSRTCNTKLKEDDGCNLFEERKSIKALGDDIKGLSLEVDLKKKSARKTNKMVKNLKGGVSLKNGSLFGKEYPAICSWKSVGDSIDHRLEPTPPRENVMENTMDGRDSNENGSKFSRLSEDNPFMHISPKKLVHRCSSKLESFETAKFGFHTGNNSDQETVGLHIAPKKIFGPSLKPRTLSRLRINHSEKVRPGLCIASEKYLLKPQVSTRSIKSHSWAKFQPNQTYSVKIFLVNGRKRKHRMNSHLHFSSEKENGYPGGWNTYFSVHNHTSVKQLKQMIQRQVNSDQSLAVFSLGMELDDDSTMSEVGVVRNSWLMARFGSID